MIPDARHALCRAENRSIVRQPGSVAMTPSQCSTEAPVPRQCLVRTKESKPPSQHRSVAPCQIRAQPAAASDFAPRQAQLPRLPLGCSLDAYPSLAGRNILVTGSGRGIGLHTARLLALMGAHVYITDVSAATIGAAVAEIRSVDSGGQLRAAPAMDLADLGSIASFAQKFQRQLGSAPLHALVNNAGANFMGCAPWHTPAGVAGIPQVNVLGPFALTQRLRPLLRAAGSARVVTVASVMHRKAALPTDINAFFTDWWEGGSYRNCKLAAVQLTAELQRRWQADGVTAIAVDPGAVHSAIWDASKTLGRPPGSWALAAVFAPIWDAAATYYARGLFAADAMTNAASGSAAAAASAALPLLDWPLRHISGGGMCSGIAAVPMAPTAHDKAAAAALWDACVQRAGLA